MNKEDILKKIIQEKGNCCWSKPSICKECPLSRLKQKEDGNWMSCVEAVGIEDLSEEEADAKYLEIATRLLIDKEIDTIIGEDSGAK
mgnify:CR=1 FL=1|jgi:hypothetical protein